MRNTIQRGTALVAVLLLALMAFAQAPAWAQDDDDGEGDLVPVDCSAIGRVQVDEYTCGGSLEATPGPTATASIIITEPRPTVVDEPTPEPTPEEDEVLGVVEVPAPPLAVTGSNVDTPVLIGFSLIGAGGIALLAARSRRDDD